MTCSNERAETPARAAIPYQLSPPATVYVPPAVAAAEPDEPDDAGTVAPVGRQSTSPGLIVRFAVASFASSSARPVMPARDVIVYQLSPDPTV